MNHIPNEGEQMVRYYGFYSIKSRGMRKKAGIDDHEPAWVESVVSSSTFRRNWAWLVQEIFQIDPLLDPKCQGPMKFNSLRPKFYLKAIQYRWPKNGHFPD